MNTQHTSSEQPTRGRGVGEVAFLFGLTGRTALPGVVLRRLLADLGHPPDATRTLLARMVRGGLLSSRRQGRTTEYALAGALLAGWERVRDQAMTQPVPWPGHFHTLLHTVPEEHRAYRDQLRRAAVLAGYGVLQPGVLIAPTNRAHRLAGLLAETPAGARVRLGTLGLSTADAAEAASVAWDLPALAATYRTHVARLDEARAEDLGAYVRAYQPALTDTLREPALDARLLPAGWPGAELRRAFAHFEHRHAGLLDAYLDAVLGSAAAPTTSSGRRSTSASAVAVVKRRPQRPSTSPK